MEEGASVSIGDDVVIFSTDCPIRISDISEPVCSIVTPAPLLMGIVGIIVQVLSGIVIVVTVITVTTLIVVCLCKLRRKR